MGGIRGRVVVVIVVEGWRANKEGRVHARTQCYDRQEPHHPASRAFARECAVRTICAVCMRVCERVVCVLFECVCLCAEYLKVPSEHGYAEHEVCDAHLERGGKVARPPRTQHW